MLRGDALIGRPGCQQERSVPMPAGRAEFVPERRTHRRSRGIRRGRGAADLAGLLDRGYPSPKTPGWAGYMGNVGLV